MKCTFFKKKLSQGFYCEIFSSVHPSIRFLFLFLSWVAWEVIVDTLIDPSHDLDERRKLYTLSSSSTDASSRWTVGQGECVQVKQVIFFHLNCPLANNTDHISSSLVSEDDDEEEEEGEEGKKWTTTASSKDSRAIVLWESFETKWLAWKLDMEVYEMRGIK